MESHYNMSDIRKFLTCDVIAIFDIVGALEVSLFKYTKLFRNFEAFKDIFCNVGLHIPLAHQLREIMDNNNFISLVETFDLLD